MATKEGAVNRPRHVPTLSDYTDHHDVIMDAIECLWNRAPARRDEITAFLLAIHDYHNHDQEDEDEHCDPSCPAWFTGAYCSACGKRHRKAVS